MTSQEKIEEYPFVDIFNEDEAEKNFMLSKPVCFVVFGKPGVGKTTLARHIAQEWKCIRVEALTILEEHITKDTETGVMLQSMLFSGQSIPDELLIKLMLDKLNSLEIAHFGYIITEIPTLAEEALTTLQQIALIKNLDLKPDIIINIKPSEASQLLSQAIVSNAAVNINTKQIIIVDRSGRTKVSGQRQHSTTGYIYTREQWDPEVIESRRKKKKEAHKEGKGDEEGEEEEEQEEEEAFIAEMQVVAEILQHLVQRPEDYLENIEHIVKLYKDMILQALEEIMAEHNPQYFIELDGNLPPEDLFITVIERLKYLNLRRAAVLTKLQSAEEEMNDAMDNDELFRTLAAYKLIAPRYRWQRSRWGRSCPVTLKEGNIYPGMADLSVSFLGKMYCLSSEETLKAFSLNPRPYLLPPMPAPPFKVFVFGPPSSGKTTLCNLLAKYYKGKVVDYAKLVQPRFDKALDTLIKNAVAEATEDAIRTVRERFLSEAEAKKQAIKELKMKEYGKAFEEAIVELDDEGLVQESQIESPLEDNEEAKMKSDSDPTVKSDQDDEKEPSESPIIKRSLQTSQDQKLDSKRESIEEVTADHPEVLSILSEFLKRTKAMNFEHPFEKYAEILEEVLEEVVEENRNRFSGAPKYGGWIIDNCPVIKELWTALVDKGITPDLVIYLSYTEDNGKFLLNRLYLENKTEIDSKIFERLLGELQKKKTEEEAVRKIKEEAMRMEEEHQRLIESLTAKTKDVDEAELDGEGEIEGEEGEIPEVSSEALEETGGLEEPEASEVPEPEPESETTEETTVGTGIPEESKEGLETTLSQAVVLPDFPEDSYPDVPEMDVYKDKLKYFESDWKNLELIISDSFYTILKLEIAGQTPEELLQKAVETMEKPFQYTAWEFNIEDYEEETEDFQAEAEIDEEIEEGEEEEEENEEKMKEKKRHLGDTKHFCPVVLKENFVLQPGTTEEAAKYREKVYYFSSPEAREKFVEHPQEFVARDEPLKAPPLRLCLLGPHGSGKSVCGRQLAEKWGIFHIQFEEFLQEKMMLKIEKKVGPEFEDDAEEEQLAKQELEELAFEANITLEKEYTNKPPSEVQFTEEEETIRLCLMENEPLPSEILDNILSEWWHKEPIRSTGFILDGFPRYPDEAQFLGEHGYFPDAAVVMQVDDQDVIDRLLPSQIEKWKLKQRKKLERKILIKEMKTKIRDDMIAKRRAELIAEREREKRKREEIVKEDEEMSEEETEDDEDIDNILEDEFPKEDEVMSEEEEEQETDAIERLRNDLVDKFEADMRNLQGIQDEFEKYLIPQFLINGTRKIHIVQYLLNKKLKPLVENRESIFEKCYPISPRLARKLLSVTYKYISTFGYWDPVKLSEGETIMTIENPDNPFYPVIHRQYIYFLSNKETREKFMKNPIKYIRQPKPKPNMPLKIAIVGPPKSGKTTVAKKIANEYGLKRLSVGDALRSVLSTQSDTELALMLNWHLHKGMTVPDKLAIQALEVSLMHSSCNTAGVVIDGYPVTNYQVTLLEAGSIIPLIVFELDVPSKEIFKRLLLDKKKEQSLPYPLHNSSQIIAVKNSKYHKNIVHIRQFYQEQHQNWYVIDGFHSKWWVWNEIITNVKMVNRYMQIYLERIKEGYDMKIRMQSKEEFLETYYQQVLDSITLVIHSTTDFEGKAACIDKLCITPQELISRLGEFGQYCPVSLAERHELVDCSEMETLEFAAEFRGHYYKMGSREKLDKFLESPELYVPPLAPHPLPSADMIPKRLTLSELKKRFPKCAELHGYCPVTYQDGNQRYEALVPGKIKYAIEYRDRIYICESSEKLEKFLRMPLKYWNQKLPYKLPPLKEPVHLTSLPLPGYLEQGIATSLIKAMNAVGCLKPKFPFLSVKKSALLYIAFHLKAFNPKGSEYTRKKYKKKMEQFVERCELITYLSAHMTRKYKEPQFRPIDFDHKLQTFISLKNIDPVKE